MIEHPHQAAAFSNQLRVRLLMACVRDECSLSALQKRVHLPISQLHYHVSRLLQAGLLLVSRTEARAGRPIKFYRAISDSFVVPQDRLPELPSNKWSCLLRRSLKNEQARSDELVLLYSTSPEGKLLVKLKAEEQSAPSRGMELWRLMKLGSKQRALLARELKDLLERYAEAPREAGAESFLVHAAFAPDIARR